ncbi:hypothetical protein ACLUEY_06790 [Vreelandella aquamarina]
MRQNASLLVHIGPLREESETLLEQVSQPTLLASLTAPTAARQKTLQEVLPALYLAELPVTSSGGEVDCYLYGLQDFNSLAPASELAQLYPGLGQARQKTLETQTLPQALEQAGLGEAKITHLVIEQPEMALDLLQAFSHSGLLEQLTHLWVRTSPLRLYEGMATEAELAEWCQQHGFESVEVEADDPGFYIQRFKRNPLYSQLQSSQAQLSTAQSNLEARNAELKKLTQARDKLTQQLEASQQQLKEQQAQAKKHAEALEQQLKEKESQVTKRNAELKELKQERDKLTQQLEASQQQLKEQQTQAKKHAEALEQQLKEKESLVAKRNAAVKQLKLEQDKLTQQLEASQQQQKEQQAQAKMHAEALEQQLKEKESQVTKRNAEVKQLKQEQDKLTQQLEDQKTQAEHASDKHRKQLAERETEAKQLNEERDALKKQLNQALKASQQHQQAQEEATQQLEQANQQLVERQKKLAEVEKQCHQAEQLQKETEEAHQQTQKKLEETHGWFTNRKQQVEEFVEKLKTSEEEGEKYKTYFAARKKQHEEAESQLAQAKQTLNEKDATIKQLNEQLETFQHNGERFSQLESKLDALFGEQRTYIQQTTNALGQHVTRSARQQRDEQALTHYLQHGQRPLSTQLAPGYAMALLEHYDTHHHDVVVVFGSTEITELLAQSIINARSEQPRLENGQRKQTDNDVTLSNVDLPQAIVSVEHQKKASEALKQRLSHQRLSQAVNVVYAPWVECQAQNGNGQPTLFYAAELTLQRLNQWLPEDARVLVVVGECLIDAGHSREVVLALLLQQLPTQRLDIVLEGNKNPQESNLKENWDKLLETRQRPGQWLTLPNTHSLRVEG